MNLYKGVAVRAAVGVLAVAAVASPSVAQAVTINGAGAAGTVPAVGVTITPSTTVVGGQVTVIATATNNTASTVSGALGIENPQYASERITGVSSHACAVRNLQNLIYCGNTQLAPGATMKITLSLTAIASGTDNFTVYGRITGTNDAFAYGTLTVS